MGDAQIFVRTACYNMDVGAFFTRWMRDVEDAQAPTARSRTSRVRGGGPGTNAGRRGVSCRG